MKNVSYLPTLLLILSFVVACAHKEEPREYMTSAEVAPAAGSNSDENQDLRQSAKFTTLSQNVVFAAGSSEISKSSRKALDEIALEMQRTSHSFDKVRVSGFTDARGNAEANQKLPLARANRVKSYLVTKGIPSTKIETVGKGSVQSDQMGAASQQAKDRSVQFEIVE